MTTCRTCGRALPVPPPYRVPVCSEDCWVLHVLAGLGAIPPHRETTMTNNDRWTPAEVMPQNDPVWSPKADRGAGASPPSPAPRYSAAHLNGYDSDAVRDYRVAQGEEFE